MGCLVSVSDAMASSDGVAGVARRSFTEAGIAQRLDLSLSAVIEPNGALGHRIQAMSGTG